MHVHVYERFWMGAAVVLMVVFVGAVLLTSYAMGIHPPSHVETIDPKTLETDPRFANPGVHPGRGGGVEAVIVAQMWSFNPDAIEVPAGRPVTFRITSPDVVHGFEVVGTNVNTMVVPGYVSQLTTTFDRPGEYLIVCHEYCGVGHHLMAAKLTVRGAGS